MPDCCRPSVKPALGQHSLAQTACHSGISGKGQRVWEQPSCCSLPSYSSSPTHSPMPACQLELSNKPSRPSCFPTAHRPASFLPCKSKCFACCICCPAPSTEVRVHLCCTCGAETKPPAPGDGVGDCQEELHTLPPRDSRNNESCPPWESPSTPAAARSSLHLHECK